MPLSALGLEALLERDRWIAGAGLLLLAALSWVYLIGMNGGGWSFLMAMPLRHAWTGSDLLLTYLMWVVMMTAMMTPAVAPTILLVATVERRRSQPNPLARAASALLGYFGVWAAACVVATLVQYGLHEAGVTYGAMSPLRSPVAAVGVLILVGLFELSPGKAACLRLCRSPIDTIAQYWRQGPGGSVRLGLRHGLYCLGLLGPDAGPARDRGDEPHLGRDSFGPCPRREAGPALAPAEPARRDRNPGLGSLPAAAHVTPVGASQSTLAAAWMLR